LARLSQKIKDLDGTIFDIARNLTPPSVRHLVRKLFPASMKTAFSAIYRRNEWEGGSGRGSTLENTKQYREFIARILAEKSDIGRVVDLGCGDWAFSHKIDWSSVDYLGIDVVPSVVYQNRETYGELGHFECLDIFTQPLPDGDLVILKDVLQHWPTKTIQEFLPRLKQFRWALITNCGGENLETLNTDVPMTGYRPLDLRKPPFNIKAEVSLRYHTDEVEDGFDNKLLLLIDTSNF